MKQFSERIKVAEEGKSSKIWISAKIDSWKQTLLLAWFAAWTFCGIVVASQLWADLSRDMYVFVVVYLSFWAYFEYKIAHAVLWRLYGKEIILIEPDSLKVKRDIRGYGRVVPYFKENIKKLRIVEKNPRSFAQSFNNSFWVIGGEQIVFENLGSSQGFGLQLNDGEAKKLLQYVRKRLRI